MHHIVFSTRDNSCVGAGSLTWDIASEILPSQSRTKAQTLANFVSNAAWFFITKTFHSMQDSLGLFAPFFLYGTSCIIGFVIILMLVPVTQDRNAAKNEHQSDGNSQQIKLKGFISTNDNQFDLWKKNNERYDNLKVYSPFTCDTRIHNFHFMLLKYLLKMHMAFKECLAKRVWFSKLNNIGTRELH